MLIFFAVICSCQKQDATAEQQLAQLKTELDAREDALDERLNALGEKVNALDARVNALAEKEEATANTQTAPPVVQRQDVIREAEQLKALMADPSLRNSARAEKDRMTQDPRAQRQAGLGQLQSQRPRKLEMSGGAVFPAPEVTSTPLAAEEGTSLTPSPTPQ